MKAGWKVMASKEITRIVDTVVKVINEGRPPEKKVSLIDSTQLLGSESALDSLDLFIFIVELETQLSRVGKDIDVMRIIENSINQNIDITLLGLVSQLR
jgi:acyl carrier protein